MGMFISIIGVLAVVIILLVLTIVRRKGDQAAEEVQYSAEDVLKAIGVAIPEKAEASDYATFNDITFHGKLACIQRLKELNHLDKRGEETSNPSDFCIYSLMKFYDDRDFGCLQDLTLICDDRMEKRSDVGEIPQFNIREYIRNHPQPASIHDLICVFGFEHQDLFVILTKATGPTENTLFFVANVVCSGEEVGVALDNRSNITNRSLMEIRLIGAEKDYWEAKYRVEEARDKANQGADSELTEAQRLVLLSTDPDIRNMLYWAKKYYSHQCYYQSLFYFKQVHQCLLYNCKDWDDKDKELYNSICWYIGYIYDDLLDFEKALPYLSAVRDCNDIDCIKEYINCLCK